MQHGISIGEASVERIGCSDRLRKQWRQAGVPAPAIDALVATVRSMTGKNFAAEGRTLERLGLRGMSAVEIVRVMNEGFA